MSLYDHVSALDELTNRVLQVKSSLNGSIEGLLGPMPQDPAGREDRPARSGVNGELQDRIEGLFNLVNSLDGLAAMIGDQCVDQRKMRSTTSTLMDAQMPTRERGGY